jgi:hypothetical protein
MGGVPRIARLMALATRLERLWAEGAVKNQAELARLGRVSRARVSQIMALVNLAPDLQERVLFLSPTAKERDRIRLIDLLTIASILDWTSQRRRWKARSFPVTEGAS